MSCSIQAMSLVPCMLYQLLMDLIVTAALNLSVCPTTQFVM